MNTSRKLAAILAADVAGYSRLTGLDEEGTHAQLQDHLRFQVDPKIAEHHGRVVKNTGDGLLAEFGSVVDAVRCALDIQRGMTKRNAHIPKEKRIQFRIGINVGDVMVDRGDIFGDGVNIAARLETVADPGGICVSGRVLEDVQEKLDITFEDAGEQQLKNIVRPVRVYRVWPTFRRHRAQIRLSTVATLATYWLIPRLPTLRLQHPEIHLTISTTNQVVNFRSEDFDCAIRYGVEPWPELDCHLLFRDRLIAVASRELAASLSLSDGPKALSSCPIIQARTRISDLHRWWKGKGLGGRPPKPSLIVENRSQALGAAMAGEGVTFIDPEFIKPPSPVGGLVSLFAPAVPLEGKYFFVFPPRSRTYRNIHLLGSWLAAQVGAS
jgi:class 3 adenylate cyclase/DNA-binding transcriptional LysR family regulator